MTRVDRRSTEIALLDPHLVRIRRSLLCPEQQLEGLNAELESEGELRSVVKELDHVAFVWIRRSQCDLLEIHLEAKE